MKLIKHDFVIHMLGEFEIYSRLNSMLSSQYNINNDDKNITLALRITLTPKTFRANNEL